MKANVLVKTTGMSREEWLAYRRLGIGGSDAPAICGVSRWGNPLSVYLEKTGDGQEQQDAQNNYQYWGTVLEPIIAEEFSRRTGWKVRRVNAILQHPTYPWMLANIDREVLHPEFGSVGLECKNVSQYLAKAWRDGVPEEYQVQCHHYMMVTGAKKWYIAALVGGNDFVIQLIERDPELESALFKIEHDFWTMVEQKTPPAIDDDGRLLPLVFRKREDDVIVLPDTLTGKISEYHAVSEEIQRLTKVRDQLRDELVQTLDAASPEAENFVCGKFQLSRKKVSTKRLDTKRLQSEHPALYNEYTVETMSSRLTLRSEDRDDVEGQTDEKG